MQKTRGSAIIIAMLLVTAVGAVSFTFGRVLNIQITNQTLYENGVGAYYAAESGIEEGFLRYRHSRSSQVPSFSTSTYPGQTWLASPSNVIRASLTAGNIIGSAVTGVAKSSTTGITDPNSQYYDLRMGLKTGSVSGDPTFDPTNDPDKNFHIARDDTKKIDLGHTLNTGLNLDLSFKISSSVSSPTVFSSGTCTLIEAKLVVQQISGGPTDEIKKLLKNNNASCVYGTIINDSSTTVGYDISSGIALIQGLKTKMAGTTPYYQATLFLKPIGSDIDYSLETTGDVNVMNQNPLNGANSIVTSAGYYGGVARTLEANIDSQSGSLYDLYDYVIFKNQ